MIEGLQDHFNHCTNSPSNPSKIEKLWATQLLDKIELELKFP